METCLKINCILMMSINLMFPLMTAFGHKSVCMLCTWLLKYSLGLALGMPCCVTLRMWVGCGSDLIKKPV